MEVNNSRCGLSVHRSYVQVMHFCLGLSRPQMWMSALQGWKCIRCPPGGHLPGQLPPEGTWVAQPWLPGEVSQTEARGNDPTICFKSTVMIQNQTWRKVLLPTKLTLPSTAVPRCDRWATSTYSGSTQLHVRSWPLLEWAKPHRTRVAPGWQALCSLDCSFQMCAGTEGLTHASSMFPHAWSLTQPHMPPTVHWTFFGLRVAGLTRLALSSYCPQCDR